MKRTIVAAIMLVALGASRAWSQIALPPVEMPAYETAMVPDLADPVEPPINEVDPLAAMQAEIDELRSQIDSRPYYVGSTGVSNGVGSNRTRAGWYGGFELVMVKPHFQSEVDINDTPDAATDGGDFLPPTGPLNPEYDCEVSPRVFLGVRNETGLGARVRYWNFDHNSDPLNIAPTNPFSTSFNHSLDLNVLDMEASLLRWWSFSDIELSGGVRFASYEADANFRSNPSGQGRFQTGSFEGAGPTGCLSAIRYLGWPGWSLIGNVRGSLLFGDSEYARGQIESSGVRTAQLVGDGKDDFLPVLESQLGLEYSRQFGSARFFVRGLMEAQWWVAAPNGTNFFETATTSPPPFEFTGFDTDEDVGFFGGTVAFGFMY